MWLTFHYIFVLINLFQIISGIGPGLFKLASNRPVTKDIDSSILPYSSDANSYGYWNCHTIPPNMTLCKSVGYSRMVLPNFLQHESLREAIQQANVWVALVNTDCHPDIQRFLCSLYAPVCLKSHQEAKIPPCWELCDQVRNACLPRMRLFGFDWPEIVSCQQFPRLAESMCIPPQEKNTAVTCVPCEQAITLENIASSYCMSDVVLKASVKELIPQPNKASLTLTLGPRTVALKLTRNDGTQLNGIDQYRRKRRSREKRNLANRKHRNLNKNFGSLDDEQTTFGDVSVSVSQHKRTPRNLPSSNQDYQPNKNYNRNDKKADANNWVAKRINRHKRRRRPRNSLHDLDGISELILSCSACRALMPFTSERMASSLGSQRWLVMGRRIQDQRTKKFTNQLQVTFLGLWNRDSTEFRQSIYAIKKEPVAHLCNRNQASITLPSQTQSIQYQVARPLKILRSAPSELSDSPNFDEKIHYGLHNKNSRYSFQSGVQIRNNRLPDNYLYSKPSQQYKLMNNLKKLPEIDDQTSTAPKKSSSSVLQSHSSQNQSLKYASESKNKFTKMRSNIQRSNSLDQFQQNKNEIIQSLNYPTTITNDNNMNNNHNIDDEYNSNPNNNNNKQDRKKLRKERKKWRQRKKKLSSENQINSHSSLDPHRLPINPYSE